MVSNTTILRDILFFLKDFINTNVTDPKSSVRPSGQSFVMTSYPTRPVFYPLITIKDLNIESPSALGFQSEAMAISITMEIRVWADNTQDRDTISQEVIDELRTAQIGASGTSQSNNLYDFKLLSSVNVDDPNGYKSKVIQVQYLYIAE